MTVVERPLSADLERHLCRLGGLSADGDIDEPRFTIAEAAARTGLSAHTLRYYERIGLLDEVPRLDGGHRCYTTRAIGRAVFLARMRATGMPIAQLRTYVALIRDGAHTSPQRRAVLEAHRRHVVEQLDALRNALAIIDLKIDDYRIWEENP